MAHKVTCPAPGCFAKFVSIGYHGYQDVNERQAKAYTETIGREWSGPYSEQFDYTGMPRYSWSTAFTKIKHTKNDQILALTGLSHG